MAELADAHGLGPCAERRAGSSPVPGTSARPKYLWAEVPRCARDFASRLPLAEFAHTRKAPQVQVLFHQFSNNEAFFVLASLHFVPSLSNDHLCRPAVKFDFPTCNLHVKKSAIFLAVSPNLF